MKLEDWFPVPIKYLEKNRRENKKIPIKIPWSATNSWCPPSCATLSGERVTINKNKESFFTALILLLVVY